MEEYCIITPTFSGHFKYINNYLKSFCKYVIDAKRVPIYFILSDFSERTGFEKIVKPYQDKADLIYSLNAGDVHWCVNAKGIKGVSCPSKAYGIMAASKPILGVLESGSEVRCLIEDTHGGLCCEPGEYDKVEKNIRWFIDNAGNSELKEMGARGRENLEKNLTRNVSVRKYAEEILKL